ncbi:MULTISPECIES: DUF6343 family protein [Micromonospora]|jgi:uncharacterized membrane protein YqjE|uniref:DUF6343 family protein n=1 Tax=Micromonospora sicca TaxID=2202420 RepID=A0A317DS96_9ACTN|nr:MULTISPECIES: DUF6343 family protein [unclassified Micromonospora]MBM0225137.1 hypothetical protein [Micromonospora sp. ATA51]MDZ5446575.1 DUF6343 family protein [Micromonospora sp. 4G57]MDZ5493313.1 DUF6343 family protein [Micromonospora sp. 4G53]PWR16706.1 hypothetical protein DKT69_04145 [Micromonospora sp. 4G51]
MTRSQPRRRVNAAYSALNLRLVLASFGLVAMTVFAVVAFWAGVAWLGVVCAVLAVVAAVDLIVIQRRRAARHREEPGARHSLFE